MKNAKKTAGKSALSAAILLSFLLTISGCSNPENPYGSTVSDARSTLVPVAIQTPEPTPAPTPEPTATPEPTPEPFQEYDISLMALGDQLLHMGVVSAGLQPDGTYNYDILFDNMADFLAAADIKAINQETIMGGNEKGFSGYPTFNSPTEVADAIAAAGFNVVTHATNHSADKGIDGLLYCADYWKNYPDITVVGIHTEETFGEIKLITVKDVTFALLNYTYSANADILNSSLIGHLDMLCDYDKETRRLDLTRLNPQVLEDIRAARELADVVIVFPHWGAEYYSTPNDYQKYFASQMAEAGADLIIGTHPHVTQPVEWLHTQDGREVLCFYSLGNYVSTQAKAETMLEGMAWVTFHVTEDGVVIGKDPTGMLPIVCQYGLNPIVFKKVYLLEDYTEELAASHGIAYHGVHLTCEWLENHCREVFGEMRLYRKDILPDAAGTE